MPSPQSLQNLISHLACPECQSSDGLMIDEATEAERRLWQTMLRENSPPHQRIVCNCCHRAYPVTADGIPVLWSQTLEKTFQSLEQDVNAADPTEQDVKAANIQVYDDISDAYDSEGVHADEITRSRLVSAYRDATNDRRGTHVDVGCGAGNVLEFFSEVIDGAHIGMDVSLSGLRAVRRKGFDAVLGDAERLPFPQASLSLITASSVLHHLYCPERHMQEASHALRTGGVFLTDFDPNRRAARWGWLAMQLYALRRPVYQFLSLGRRRVFHGSERVQAWNAVAEFHNKPGEGFDLDELQSSLFHAGFEIQCLFPHNCRDASVNNRSLVKPSARHLLVQSLSGRNAFRRRNSDTLLTVSVKPAIRANVHHDGKISPHARQVARKLFAEGAGALQESGKATAAGTHRPETDRIDQGQVANDRPQTSGIR